MVGEVISGTLSLFAHLDPLRRWELLKSENANVSKEYAQTKRGQEKEHKFQLTRLLSEMQNEMLHNGSETLVNNMEKVKMEIASFEKQDTQRAIFRCRRQWSLQGERPSKYFFNLEKRNYLNKSMYVVQKLNGELTKDYREILNEQKSFYEELYHYNPDIKFMLTNNNGAQLCEEERIMFEEHISKEELFDAMMTLKSEKVCGIDGLGLSFYRKFWKQLINPFHEMLIKALQTGFLSTSARHGIINLIPKRGRDDKLVKNWRPITLLNYDYKIYAKAIANRMDIVIPKLVGKQQTGFIKGKVNT